MAPLTYSHNHPTFTRLPDDFQGLSGDLSLYENDIFPLLAYLQTGPGDIVGHAGNYRPIASNIELAVRGLSRASPELDSQPAHFVAPAHRIPTV